jgi:hypothetical protein
MDTGYLSKQAVADLLAVKDGEIDYLKEQLRAVRTELKRIQTNPGR